MYIFHAGKRKYEYDDNVVKRIRLDGQKTRNKLFDKKKKREVILEDTSRARHWTGE